MTVLLVLAVVGLLIFVVVGLRLGSPAAVSPVKYFFVDLTGYLQKGLSGPSIWGKKLWRSYLALQDVELENRVLRQDVVQLQKEIGRYREALIANARYKKLLGIKENVGATVITANVVGVDLAPWLATITVDQGRKDGIKPGMVVMSGAGVAGQTMETSLHFSKVLLLSDYNSAVAAVIQRNRARGIIKGAGEGRCYLAYVEKVVDVEVGDRIITSGTDRIFPKGLLIGKVSSVTEGPISDLFQEITVTPAVDLKRVEEVVVFVTNQPFVESRH
ncbi:MAG: rod shape-determining protein MreC [Thermodesulfobacteriota bacterium]|nr:rod shape-determining protein MreC [Thermodesulfobacteriota bacterium]